MDRVVDADMCDSAGYDCWTDSGVKLDEMIDALFLLPLNIQLTEAFIIVVAIYIEHTVRNYNQLALIPHLHTRIYHNDTNTHELARKVRQSCTKTPRCEESHARHQ